MFRTSAAAARRLADDRQPGHNPTTEGGVELFERIGKEDGVSRLVDAFYGHMAEAPAMGPLLAVHPDLDHARERLYEFLVGWLGGPPLYMEKHGHPRLRMRHLHIAIDTRQATLWVQCMNHALDTTVEDAALRQLLLENFTRMAAHLRNTPDAEG